MRNYKKMLQGRFAAAFFVLSVFLLPAAARAPRNVVALSKSVAEMWLLAGGELAGSTSDALELAASYEGAGQTVSVGTLTTASLEAIIGLNPALVILTLDIPCIKSLRKI